MSAVEELAAEQANGKLDPDVARGQLEAMWNLGDGHVHIEGARITGQGRGASCEVRLTNGETMVFESLGDIATGVALPAELASCAGVAVKLSPHQKVVAIVLIRALAERQAGETADSIARDWGIEFLATCQQVEVNMADQAQRWAIFEQLRSADPWALAREHSQAVARHMLVPVDHSGVRYVRVGWYQAYVKESDGTVSTTQVVARMLRVGWQRRGTEGRIHARRPRMPGQATIKFLLVPAAWENPAAPLVPAGTRPTREGNESARARDISTTSGYQANGHAPDGHPAELGA